MAFSTAAPESQSGRAPREERFAMTRWSLVLAAEQGSEATVSQRALAELCGIYWKPLYDFIRRNGYDRHAAEDLTQEFFARLLAQPPWSQVQPERGRFRSYLLASVKHFLANEWDRAQALKRGGGRVILSLDALAVEGANEPEAGNDLSPDAAFDRQWALTLLEQVIARLRGEFIAEGREAFFETLKPFLTGHAEAYATVAPACGLSESALKVAVHRLRQRYRKLLREEIAGTLSSSDEVEAEMRSLSAALTPSVR
ncbi:MAG: sigma factor [Chthoniobacteraceae bacterium]